VREHRTLRRERFRAVAAGYRQRMRRLRVTRGDCVSTGEHMSHARLLECRRRIDRLDFGMRVIRAHEIAIELPGSVPVGCVLACACDETLVFDSIAVMRVPVVLVVLVMRIHEFPE
jgi:hypothetical protein